MRRANIHTVPISTNVKLTYNMAHELSSAALRLLASALGVRIIFAPGIFMFMLSVLAHGACLAAPVADDLEIGYLTASDFPAGQSGCWYYYPAEKRQTGSIIGLGEAAEEAIYMIINGEKVMVGNWVADYQETYHSISYKNDQYEIDIVSRVLNSGNYSFQYESTITVKTDSSQSVIQTFGECGS